MLKHRHFISYFSTTLLYLFIAGIIFYIQNNTYVAAQKAEKQVMQIDLTAFVPETVMPVEEVEEIEREIVEKEPIVEEKPVVEQEIIKEPILQEEPEVKKNIISKPPTKTPKKKVEVKHKTQKKPAKEKKENKKVSARKTKISHARQNQFLASIRTKIDKHKSYPRIAKKRGMQGSVKVKFTILSSGQVGQIGIDGPKVFHASAISAVKSAFPINVKEAPIKLPMSINITLQYQIR